MGKIGVYGKREKLQKVVNGINPLDHDALVMRIAFKFGGRSPIKDSVQYADGWIGLIRACELYNPNLVNPQSGQPYCFSTYAYYWIRRHICMDYTGKSKAARHAYGKEPFLFSTMYQEGEIPFEHSIVGKEFDPAVIVEGLGRIEIAYAICQELLRFIPEHWQQVINLRMEGYTLRHIGECIGVTRERVRQIEEKALHKMKCHANQIGFDPSWIQEILE